MFTKSQASPEPEKKINKNEIFENSMVTENRFVKTAEKMKSIKNQN